MLLAGPACQVKYASLMSIASIASIGRLGRLGQVRSEQLLQCGETQRGLGFHGVGAHDLEIAVGHGLKVIEQTVRSCGERGP